MNFVSHVHLFTKLHVANLKSQWYSWRVIVVLHTNTHMCTNCADKKGNSHDRFPADCTCRDFRPSVPFELKCRQKDCNSEKADLQPESSQSRVVITSCSHSTEGIGHKWTLSNRDPKWFLCWVSISPDQILLKVGVSLILAACEGREDTCSNMHKQVLRGAVQWVDYRLAHPVQPQLGLLHPLLQGCL